MKAPNSGGRGGGHARAQFLELRAHLVDGRVEARGFLRRLLRRHGVMLDLEAGVRHQLRLPDGDAAGDADAVDGEAHSSRVRSEE